MNNSFYSKNCIMLSVAEHVIFLISLNLQHALELKK